MSLIIGILGRPRCIENREITSFNKAVTDAIVNYGHIPLGIIAPLTSINEDLTETDAAKLHQVLSLCDGIILQGGSDYYEYDLEALKYIHEKHIPVLGICLGMQTMGAYFGGSLVKVPNHNHPGVNYVHEVKLDDDSLLRKIMGKKILRVNSRHSEMVINPTNIDVVGTDNKNIEAIEKKDANFFIGVQWHPEDMLKYDEESRKLFEAFFTACNIYNQS